MICGFIWVNYPKIVSEKSINSTNKSYFIPILVTILLNVHNGRTIPTCFCHPNISYVSDGRDTNKRSFPVLPPKSTISPHFPKKIYFSKNVIFFDFRGLSSRFFTWKFHPCWISFVKIVGQQLGVPHQAMCLPAYFLLSNSLFRLLTPAKKPVLFKFSIRRRILGPFHGTWSDGALLKVPFFRINFFLQIATTSSRRATSCMRFSRTHSQTVHSAASSAITKSESGSRLNHRTVNNTAMSDDGIDTAMQIDNQNEVSIQDDWMYLYFDFRFREF